MTRMLGLAALIFVAGAVPHAGAAEPLKVGVFAVDASPPIGSPLAYDPTKGVAHPLSCRGVVLVGAEKPVVLCAVDWIGIANDGQVEFRRALAQAAGTDPSRVVVHTLHQHDAPVCDFSTDRMLASLGINREYSDAGLRARRDRTRRRGRPGGDESGPTRYARGAGCGRGRKSGVEPASAGRRRQGGVRALYRMQGPRAASQTGRND